MKIEVLTVKEIKEAAKKAAEIRETSYKPGGEDPIVEPGKYVISMETACETACQELDLPKDLAYLLYLALDCAWNDVLDWAGR